MNLVNKEVIHKTFGKGNIVDYDDSYVNIDFESGTKRFMFPDVFGKFATFVDKKAAKVIKEKLAIRKVEKKEEEIIQEKERALERERQQILIQERQMRGRKIHPQLQSVFWVKEDEEEKVFTDWQIFAGRIKSGKKKGEPRRLPRMNQKSACLLTMRESDEPEKDRRIIGVFLVEQGFNGKLFEDGYIPAHPRYRLRLTKEESDKMLFWNYYYNRRTPDKMIWNSGRQRYFDNKWMAQILRDIAELREKPEEKEKAQEFFEHFSKINRISMDELPKNEGALKRS